MIIKDYEYAIWENNYVSVHDNNKAYFTKRKLRKGQVVKVKDDFGHFWNGEIVRVYKYVARIYIY
jgi:hypothetical protein